MMNDYQEPPKDHFVINIRDKVRIILKNVFKRIPVEKHFEHVVSIVKTCAFNYPRLESCVFFISGMKTDNHYSMDFYEVVESILNIPQNAPALMIETCCRFLRDMILHTERQQMFCGLPVLALNSIYKWLSRVSEPFCKLIQNEVDACENMRLKTIADIHMINNILVFCHELDDFLNLLDVIGRKISKHISADDKMHALKHLVKFYSKVLCQDFNNNRDSSDSARFAELVMREFLNVCSHLGEIIVQPDDVVAVNKAVSLCVTVMNRFKDNERIGLVTGHTLYYILSISGEVYEYHEYLYERLLKLYKYSSFMWYIKPFIAFINVYEKDISRYKWYFKFCKDIYYYVGEHLSKSKRSCLGYLRDIMELLHRILRWHYDEVLENECMESIIRFACRGLLKPELSYSYECSKVLIELFANSSFSVYDT
ncbi:hypothetical protein RF11_11750 [Thelohanellus kitauei]|uniref:Uncharacterized protein n=1 Tax=Thelohanellus kitauei TaxID=669202 RepID=A0A0C2NBB2_THEKT|nr:hypothetical protein RF11_11750 [Thelohanellus kitauei]